MSNKMRWAGENSLFVYRIAEASEKLGIADAKSKMVYLIASNFLIQLYKDGDFLESAKHYLFAGLV